MPGDNECLVDRESGSVQTDVYLLGGPREFPVVLWRGENTAPAASGPDRRDAQLEPGGGWGWESFAEAFNQQGTAAFSRANRYRLKLEDCVINKAQGSEGHFRFGAFFTYIP